jgi:hypothetical protein
VAVTKQQIMLLTIRGGNFSDINIRCLARRQDAMDALRPMVYLSNCRGEDILSVFTTIEDKQSKSKYMKE